MKIQQYPYTVLYAFVCLLLWIGILKWGYYLIEQQYIHPCSSSSSSSSSSAVGVRVREAFDPYVQANIDTGSPQTSHSVDLPLTTTTQCQNMCGSTGRCYYTGQQCTSDIDCPGCNPGRPSSSPSSLYGKEVPGNNTAGKLTGGVTLTYSSLTNDLGTRARLYNPTLNPYDVTPVTPYLGINLWKSRFDAGTKQFNQRYQYRGLPDQPQYPQRSSIIGDFKDDGPLASNDFLSPSLSMV